MLNKKEGNVTLSVSSLNKVNKLYGIGIITEKLRLEYVNLIRKGFNDASYLDIIGAKIKAKYSNESITNLTPEQMSTYQDCITHFSSKTI